MNSSEREELSFYRALMKSMNGFIYVLNMHPYKVEWINDSDTVKKFSGQTAKEIIKNGAFIPTSLEPEPDFRESVTNAIKAFEQDPDIDWGGMFRFIKDKKTATWVAYASATLSTDKYGQADKVISVAIPMDSLFHTPDTMRLFHEYCSHRLNESLIASLTNRQKEILTLIGQGKIRKEIAEELNLAITTIDDHKKALFKKFGVKKMSELAVKAQEIGLLSLTNEGN